MAMDYSQPINTRKGLDFWKGLGHLLEIKKKFKHKAEKWPPGDIKPGQEEGYARWLTEFADHDLYESELEYCCRYDLPRRLDIICHHLNDQGLQVSDIPMKSKATWLILATSNISISASRVLIKYSDRNLILKTSDTDGYTGLTAIHCAVINSMIDAVKEMLERLETEEQSDLIQRHVTGDKIIQRNGASSLALNLACRVGNIDIFEELLDRGGELDKKDTKGGNVIHTLVEVGMEKPDDAKSMVRKVFGSLAARRWYCRRFGVEERYWTSQEDKDLKKVLLSMENSDGYTPLTLAAKMGATEMLDFVINSEGVYRNTLWRFGVEYIVEYDVTEVNPVVRRDGKFDRATVITLLVYKGMDPEQLQAFTIPVIKNFVCFRWKWYRFLYFFWAVWHVLTMILCFYIPVTYINGKDAFLYPSANRTLPHNSTLLPLSEGILDLSHMSRSTQVTFLILLCLLVLNIAVCVFYEISDIFRSSISFTLYLTRKWHDKYYKAPLAVMLKWDILRFGLTVFLVTETQALVELFVNAEVSFGLVATSSIFGWYFVLFFSQGFRATGYFSVIMHRILFTDLFSFGFVFLILQLGFGSSMMFLVNREDLKDYGTIWSSFYTVWKIILGFGGQPNVKDEARQTMLHIVFIMMLTISLLLLLNMLIAAMSETYSSLAQHREQLWVRSTAAAMLLIERRFFGCFSSFINKKCLRYDNDLDRWYFQINTQVPPT